MYRQLKKLYKEIKKQYMENMAVLVPEKYWSQFVCVGGASDYHYVLKKVVPKDKKKVLIVGVHGGRDYFYFKTAGYDVKGLDLFPDKDFGEMIIGNIEDVNLSDKSFDVIVASAVIEHVNNDYGAIKNIQRILKDDGIFIIGIPYYDDFEITHIHIYSRKSIKRLLEGAGFSIQNTFEYPNLLIYQVINFLNHALNAFTFKLFGKTIYAYTLPPFWKLEFFLSRQSSWPFRFFRSFFGNFGNGVCTILVCKKGEVFDNINFNKTRFEPK